MRLAFETLNGEAKPEHAGFGDAAGRCFDEYSAQLGLAGGAGKEGLLEYLYDEYFTELQLARAEHFFGWLGLVKPPLPPLPPPDVSTPLLVPPASSTGAHSALASCDAFEAQTEGGDDSSEAAAFAGRLVALLAAGGDQHQAASWLETWQDFELEHSGAAVAQVATHVLTNGRFAPLIARGLTVMQAAEGRASSAWLRNGAGVLFRLRGLLANGTLGHVPTTACTPLLQAYDAIFVGVERSDAALDGAHLGAFYTQALVAWLCAHMAEDDPTGALAQTVRRAGHAVVRLVRADPKRRKDTRAHVEEMYVEASHEPVWGGREKDIVWAELFQST